MKPLRGKRLSSNYWSSVQTSPSWTSWAGYSFEWFCEKHSWHLLKSLGIHGISSVTGKWRNAGDTKQNISGREIDLLIDRADQMISICELKFTREPFVVTKKHSQEILEKISLFVATTKTKKHCSPVLVSASGALKNALVNEVYPHVINLEDMFEL